MTLHYRVLGNVYIKGVRMWWEDEVEHNVIMEDNSEEQNKQKKIRKYLKNKQTNKKHMRRFKAI